MAVRCPFCASEDTQVKDSRPAEDNQAIAGVVCVAVVVAVPPLERVQLRELTVVKTDGETQPFDREKLTAAFR